MTKTNIITRTKKGKFKRKGEGVPDGELEMDLYIL